MAALRTKSARYGPAHVDRSLTCCHGSPHDPSLSDDSRNGFQRFEPCSRPHARRLSISDCAAASTIELVMTARSPLAARSPLRRSVDHGKRRRWCNIAPAQSHLNEWHFSLPDIVQTPGFRRTCRWLMKIIVIIATSHSPRSGARMEQMSRRIFEKAQRSIFVTNPIVASGVTLGMRSCRKIAVESASGRRLRCRRNGRLI